jgi:fumarylacetoacetase
MAQIVGISTPEPARRSWVPVSNGSDFPIENLPFGVFTTRHDDARIGVAIGEHILDLAVLAAAGLLDGLHLPEGVFAASSLNGYLALDRVVWTNTRARIATLLGADDTEIRRRSLDDVALVTQADADMLLPIDAGDYVDFYSSIHHATNVGLMFRPDSEPLPESWRHLPVAYHGRTGTLVVDGTPITRPNGQRRNPARGAPLFGPSVALDFELEVGFVTGGRTVAGQTIRVDDAEDHIFGLCLVNDWSARDIQAWEYQPLGPFLGKSFATTVAPWIVTLDALAPYRVDGPAQEPEPLPYLRTGRKMAVDIELEVEIVPAGAEGGTTVTRTRFRDMYWTMAQQLAHATVNGATARPGDLFASGTVSGPGSGSLGCLLEITRNGTQPIRLDDGSDRAYLADGDTVVMRGVCGDRSGPHIGFGPCRGSVRRAER